MLSMKPINTFAETNQPHDDISSITASWVKIEASTKLNLALMSDGRLWGWGYLQLEPISFDSVDALIKSSPIKLLDNVSSMASGKQSFVIKTDGSLWCLGNDHVGSIGNTILMKASERKKIMDDVLSVSTCKASHFAIKTDGSLWAWGDNSKGQLGTGNKIYYQDPVKIMDEVTNVSTGDAFSIALKNDGSLWAWGDNLDGQLVVCNF